MSPDQNRRRRPAIFGESELGPGVSGKVTEITSAVASTALVFRGRVWQNPDRNAHQREVPMNSRIVLCHKLSLPSTALLALCLYDWG
jgi:hypothetical protein